LDSELENIKFVFDTMFKRFALFEY